MIIIRRQILFVGSDVTHLVSDRMVLDLVEHIYAAGCDPDQWKTFVDRVHEAVPGSAFSIHLSIEGTRLSGSAAGIPPEQIESYFAHYHRLNPYNDLFRKIPVGQVHTVSGLVPEGWLDRHIFYHEWLKPAGDLKCGTGLVIARDSRRLLRLSFDLPYRLAHLEKPAAALVGRLGPHLARAFEVNERLGAASAAETTLEAMIGRVDGAAMLVSAAGKAAMMNTAGEALARAGSLFKISKGEGRLCFSNPDDEGAYARLLETALDAAARGGPRAFRAAGDPAGTVVTVLPLRPLASFAGGVAGAMALVVVRTGEKTEAIPKDVMRSLYRLTPAESDVASLIASGRDVTEVAEILEVSKVTVRNQLAAAMGKMGVNRQAELVAAVAALSVRLK